MKFLQFRDAMGEEFDNPTLSSLSAQIEEPDAATWVGATGDAALRRKNSLGGETFLFFYYAPQQGFSMDWWGQGQPRLSAVQGDAQNPVILHIGGTRHERTGNSFLPAGRVIEIVDYFMRIGGPAPHVKWVPTQKIEL
jgi:hypothetical protein